MPFYLELLCFFLITVSSWFIEDMFLLVILLGCQMNTKIILLWWQSFSKTRSYFESFCYYFLLFFFFGADFFPSLQASVFSWCVSWTEVKAVQSYHYQSVTLPSLFSVSPWVVRSLNIHRKTLTVRMIHHGKVLWNW